MLILILGIILFLGVHVFATLRPQRAALIERVGLKTYKTGYAAVAATGLLLIIFGFIRYRSEGLIRIWDPPHWLHHVAMPLVWFAFVAFAARRAPAGRIKGWLRHPMLVAIKAWALAHFLVNGDLGGMLLFCVLPGLRRLRPHLREAPRRRRRPAPRPFHARATPSRWASARRSTPSC